MSPQGSAVDKQMDLSDRLPFAVRHRRAHV